MAATDRITPIDESEVAVNECAGSECSEPTRAVLRHLPDERRALTHHFSIAGQEGYLTVGVYEDGLPGEIFITMAKKGSTKKKREKKEEEDTKKKVNSKSFDSAWDDDRSRAGDVAAGGADRFLALLGCVEELIEFGRETDLPQHGIQ